jgi:transposase-like protein
MGDLGYPPEFRRRVLYLIHAAAGSRMSRDLEISDRTIYVWRKQHRLSKVWSPVCRAANLPGIATRRLQPPKSASLGPP